MKFNIQKFAEVGTFPVFKNIFKIGLLGRESTLPADMVIIKDLETFSPSIDAQTQEWTPMETEGWVKRMVTGKGLSFAFSGKRNYGDPGNDYVAKLLIATGQDVESIFEWELPSGDKLVMDCIVNLSQTAGGASTDVDSL